jgi:hypothetical protein
MKIILISIDNLIHKRKIWNANNKVNLLIKINQKIGHNI